VRQLDEVDPTVLKTEHRYYRCITRDKNGRKACASRPLTAGAIELFVVERLREAAAGGVLAADVERRLKALAEHRRSELLTERRDLPPVIAKLSVAPQIIRASEPGPARGRRAEIRAATRDERPSLPGFRAADDASSLSLPAA
jgi:hypothetical protein